MWLFWQEINTTTAVAMGRHAAWRAEGNNYVPAGLAGASPESKACSESCMQIGF